MSRAAAVDRCEAIVVGGGIAGLVAAWELGRAGSRVVLLEAAPQLGGCVARHRVAGLELDAGAESFAVAGGTVTTLLTDLGLHEQIAAPNAAGAWVLHEAGAAPLPVGGLLGIPARPLAADVRRVLGTGAALRAAADRFLPAGFGVRESTLGGLVGRRMGRRVVRRLVEPVAGGVYSTDPDELETVSVNPRLLPALGEQGSLAGAVRELRGGSARPGSAVLGLTGGVFTLVQALETAIHRAAGRIQCDTAVRSVATSGRGGTVQTDKGPIQAPLILLATDGITTRRLLGLEHDGAAATSEVLLVTLVVDEPALDPAPRGTGVLVSRHAHGVTAKALTHATAKWPWLAAEAGPGRHVLRLSYGRGAGPLPDSETAIELARADAATLLGVPINPATVAGSAVVRWTSAVPRPQVGHLAAVARLRAALPGGIAVLGADVAGTGLATVIADARRTVADSVR